MTLPLVLVLGTFPLAMAYAAASDLFSMTISNRLTLVVVFSFILCAFLVGMGWAEIGWHVAAGALMLSATFAMFAMGWIGGGDAKLAAATALWFGFDHLGWYLAIAGMLGGALTLAIVVYRSRPWPAPVSGWSWARRLHAADEGVPYGIALAASALLILPETAIWRAAIGA